MYVPSAMKLTEHFCRFKENDRISSMAAIITAMTYCDESAKTKAELAELKTLDKTD